MQLARHSDPKLTQARYGRIQIHDLGEAVNRLPSLVSSPEPERVELQATGTDSNSPLALGLRDKRDSLSPSETAGAGGDAVRGSGDGLKIVTLQGIENERDRTGLPETNTPGVTRTHDIRFRKPMLYPAELRGQISINPVFCRVLPLFFIPAFPAISSG